MSIDYTEPIAETESLVRPERSWEDGQEYSLRPTRLSEYIGQAKAKGNLEIFIQDCCRLHIITDYSLFQHVENIVCKNSIATLRKRFDYINSCDASLHHIIGCHQIRCHISFQCILASMCIGNCFHLLICNFCKTEIFKDCLDSFSRFTTNTDHIFFCNRTAFCPVS